MYGLARRLQTVHEAFRNVRRCIDAYQEQIVPMDIFEQRLRERAQQLGISNAEAGRRAGLDERRYAHYANGRREPDLATLVKIAVALHTTPNWLLGVDQEREVGAERGDLLGRLMNSASSLPDAELRTVCVLAEALVREEGDPRKPK